MKLPAAKQTSFIAKPDKNISAALIYGPDIGKVALLAKQLENNITGSDDPFAVTDINIGSIYQSGAIVADELAAVSFFSGRRVIKILNVENTANIRLEDEDAEKSSKNVRNVEALVVDAIENAFEILPPATFDNAFLIVTAANLDKKSALRNFFEKHNNVAAIACYEDEEKQLEAVIITELKNYGIDFEREVPSIIEKACRGNRMVAVNEVAKIALFLNKGQKLTAFDTRSLVGISSETSIEDICNLVANGEIGPLQKTLQKAFSEDVLPIILLRSMQRYFEKINMAVAQMDKGADINSAISSIRPPVFYKQEPVIRRQISRWKPKGEASFLKAYNMLYDAESECKKQGANQEIIVSSYFSKIAQI